MDLCSGIQQNTVANGRTILDTGILQHHAATAQLCVWTDVGAGRNDIGKSKAKCFCLLMKAIYDFLSQKVDVHGARLAPELIDQFVEVVTPIADYSYRWKLNTGCKKSKEERADLMAVSEKPILTFTIDFETAKRYREANKMPHQFRRAAWTDLTVEVYL